MNFNSQGLIISIIILISMMLICHTVNFLYPKNINYNINHNNYNKPKPHNKNQNSFSNLLLAIPNNTLPNEYNKIYYDYDNKNKQSECNLKKEAEIPCKVVSSCNSTSTPTKYQLSDSELAVVYRDAYASAGREVLLRTLNEE